MWPPVLRPLADAAHQLSELLGDANDLAVLLEFASRMAPIRRARTRAAALAAVVSRP